MLQLNRYNYAYTDIHEHTEKKRPVGYITRTQPQNFKIL